MRARALRSRGGGACAAVTLLAVLAGLTPAVASPVDTYYAPPAVVAVIDTGINPYHDVFADERPRAYQHPSTYIEGFPKDAEALRLTLDEPDYWQAVAADCDVWNAVDPQKLYWIPGTKIVGAITFDTGQTPVSCQQANAQPAARILDNGAHGTMTASRAVGTGYGACADCLVVAVQGFSQQSIDWSSDNADWIDAQSHSWGPTFPVWTPSGASLLTSNPSFVRAVERSGRKHLSFWASGNGTLTRFGVVGHPTPIDPRMTPSIVMVGGHDSGYINTWPDFPPHVVSDSCNSWAAYHDKTNESADDVGGGTSGATPFAAGGALRVLMEARSILGDDSTGVTKGVVARGRTNVGKGPLADGVFTLKEWKEVVFKTATPRPKRQREDGSVCDAVAGLVIYSSTPVKWQDVPEGYPEYLHIGYGAVDRPAIELATAVLRGKEALPDRSATDAYFERDRTVREVLHDVFDG